MSVFAVILLFLGVVSVSCQVATPTYNTRVTSPTYDTHDPYFTVITKYVTETVTVTHTLRETSTSDVWITDQTTVVLPVTQYTTDWDFVSSEPYTRTSVVRVTSTPVIVTTVTSFTNPVRTVTSIFTSFFTSTTILEFWQSITHVSLAHQIFTKPVFSTQELVQEIVTTVTQIVTSTVTSSTGYLG
ncbi:uncharacterized protein LOC121857450 [Homarus americanus]|uniref:uncharacterized protein LOC121857450 n=1 Tax=Homarus americanus TaxID=6706 RepID=UPI001C46D284|nr:uncharacterized protein LOC121857450 [Homarus americanus]